jgi:type IV pilus assembly protein PilY1
VAYDPSTTYTPPIKADGNSYGNASYPKAKTDGYVSDSGTVDLSGHVFYTYKGTQDKMGWTYTADKKSPVNNDFYKECSSTVGDDPGKSVFTQRKVSDLSAANKTNYANWFSYYRKRYLLMRTAMGRAMFGLNDGYRVGFTAINDDNNFIQSNSSTFVNVDDFTASHKTRLFKSLYGIGPGGGTPLRQALANTGRYFAKKHANQKDPMTLSCQRNYALLTTDGYWNGSNGTKLDGTSIGQEDGSEARPMSDATSLNLKVVTTYEVTETRNSTTTSTWLVPGKRIKTTVNSKAEKSGDYQGLYKVTTQAQTTKSDDSNRGTRTKTVITPQQRTVTRTITITKYENGTESAPSINDTAGNWDSSAAPETSWSEISWKTKNTNWTDSGSATISYQAAKGSGSPVYSDPEATGEGVQSGGAITTYGTESEASVTQKG